MNDKTNDGGQQQQQQQQQPWHKPFGFDDTQVRYLADKGIGGPADLPKLLKSTMDFEQIVRDRDLKNYIRKPDPAKISEWEGWGEFGWKEKPEEYQFKALDDEAKKNLGFEYNAEVFDALRQSAHKHRIPLSMAQAIHDDMLAFSKQKSEGLKAKGAADTSAMEAALQAEWKGDYPRKVEIAKRAAGALGVGIEDAGELEKLVGAPRLLKMFAQIGEALGESKLVGDRGDRAGLPDSVDAIEAELRKLEGDDNWMKIFNDQRHPSNKDYIAQRQRLLDKLARAQQPRAA